MSVVSLKPADLNKGMQPPKGFYKFEITGKDEKLASSGNSTNLILDFTVFGSGEHDGKQIREYINLGDFGMGTLSRLYKAITGSLSEPTDLDLDKLLGAKLSGSVEEGTYNGKPSNSITDFYPEDYSPPF